MQMRAGMQIGGDTSHKIDLISLQAQDKLCQDLKIHLFCTRNDGDLSFKVSSLLPGIIGHILPQSYNLSLPRGLHNAPLVELSSTFSATIFGLHLQAQAPATQSPTPRPPILFHNHQLAFAFSTAARNLPPN
jgi:hypothetical protein